ncbi:polyamine aminopropyltransferase [Desulfonema ishimotonii]|uniref:Polyamine aminopropyltransferase n=1 Tax=Desulfonema ishimotonii TaxID=45657 RepID=A0A401G2D9_9BACT|nr:hypothetical protein [Desulfonema ishimotonii]GBC63408.1 polyamine aminopropyltransferase [Desulfonema ishimotonii]
MECGVYISDKSGNSFANLFRAERILYDGRSAYQKIMVFDTQDLGRVLMLDDFFNVSTIMEAFYHEPMAHIPLAMAENRENVLIVGGGDFGVAKHVLKHSDVRQLTLCELDPRILEISREFFSDWAACEKDPRLSVRVGDGAKYIEECPPESLDAVIIDTTDPFFNASVLVTDAFYTRVLKALRPGGVMIQIIADFIFYRSAWFDVLPVARRNFPTFRPVFVPIPLYVTGCWGLLLAGRRKGQLDISAVSQAYLDRIGGVETMTPDLVRGWMSLPPFLEKEFAPWLEK